MTYLGQTSELLVAYLCFPNIVCILARIQKKINLPSLLCVYLYTAYLLVFSDVSVYSFKTIF